MYDEKPTSRHGARRRPYHLRCAVCFREFTAKRVDAKYCAAACRVKAQRDRDQVAADTVAARVMGAPAPKNAPPRK